MDQILQILEKNRELMKVIQFFQERLSFIDFLIIVLGTFLLLWQIWKRLTTFSGRFYRKAKENPLFLVQAQLKLDYLSNLIEVLPMLGLFGTVWGLMLALVVLSNNDAATIKDIATQIAPAISTTFFGLFFAITNMILYNNLHTYYAELIAWCRQHIPEQAQASVSGTLPPTSPLNVMPAKITNVNDQDATVIGETPHIPPVLPPKI